ncbi:hypothetical protein [Micromonospora sp. 4G55]|uniref:hypothetical protein n=1 Tax=Micromonospora sp. 4G55 TaxID=2806102 RepID=UPI001A387254|nr:hypothetical protein [Micromonospora sp. 4G55]MBM0255511.1 hypothetical protein [Micromonospora sp. 4G55]
MTRTLHLAAALLLAATGLAGCASDEEPAAAPSPTPAAATSAAPTATAVATTSPSPTAAGDTPLALGKSRPSPDGAVVSTVFAYKQPVARSAPRPDEQPNFEWGAADIKVCVNKGYIENQIVVSNSSWALTYADDTQIEASSTGYDSFPKPEYPWGEKALAPGRCVRGWITFPVPARKRPVFVEYAADSEPVPPRWAVK